MTGVFKSYDIRGKIDQLPEPLVTKAGYAFCEMLQEDKKKEDVTILVGQDMRPSSPEITQWFIKGITLAGGNVIDIGQCSTPMTYFGLATYKYDGSAMITASHNPAEYNGIKVCRKGDTGPISISEDNGLKELEKRVQNIKSEQDMHKDLKGVIIEKDILKDYIDFLKQFASEKIKNKQKQFKIVVDAGNGMAGLEIPAFQKHFTNIEIIPLYFELDGTFPNHEANPSKTSTLKALQEKVKETNADFGIAFDGDADRMGGLVDENGVLYTNDMVTALMAEERVKENQQNNNPQNSDKKNNNNSPGKVLYVVPSSRIIAHTVEQAGGKAIMSRVGRAFVVEGMKEHDAIFGGEFSGHYCFPEFWYFDCALLAFINLLNVLAKKDKSVSQIMKQYEVFFASGEINLEVDNKSETLKKIKEHYEDGTLIELDGVSISYDDFWFNVRASNTEPILRVNIEATTKELMQEEKEKLLKVIQG